uniref:Uncharacterized protein n=2 Tax=Salix TaxID=40685 RepID=A0A6N2MZN3_SALVM
MGRWMRPEVSNHDHHLGLNGLEHYHLGLVDSSRALHVSHEPFLWFLGLPLVAAMTCVASMCVFQLTRSVFMNPDVRINKANRRMGVLENKEEGEKYAEHGLRRFLRTRPPEIMPAINHFFSEDNKSA